MIQDIFPHRFNNTYKPLSAIGENDYVFHFRENTLLLLKNESGYAIPTKGLLKNVVDQGSYNFV